MKILIFGCPKNRNNSENKPIDNEILNFFRDISNFAYKNNCFIVLETMTKKYNCNFINNIEEAIELIEKVNSKGLKLHIDSGNLYNENEDLENIIKYKEYIYHAQISELGLKNFNNLPIGYNLNLSNALKNINYSGKISIEMANVTIEDIKNSVSLIKKIYI